MDTRAGQKLERFLEHGGNNPQECLSSTKGIVCAIQGVKQFTLVGIGSSALKIVRCS